jgi:hypothetical protein
MLSVIILCGFGRVTARPDAVVRTLVPLVGASVRGQVRDVVLTGPPEAELRLIAEHAGCAVVEAATEAQALRRAVVAARTDDLMFLHAGYVPQAGFFEEIEDLLNIHRLDQTARVLKAAPVTFYEQMLPGLAPAVGFIAGRRLCAAAERSSFQELRRAAGARKALQGRLRRIA